MELQESYAQDIVSELSKLLGTKINIMNSRGFIIASSDPDRIGSFHAGAYEIIENNLDSLEIIDGTTWEGAVPGQNFPIRLNGKVVGVVGITGSAESTRKYGAIIRKMTEILLAGKEREQEQKNKQAEKERFLVNWISGGEEVISDDLKQYGLDLGIDITQPRRIAVLYITFKSEPFSEESERYVKSVLTQSIPEALFFNSSNYLVCTFPEKKDESLRLLFSAAAEKLARKNIMIAAGIGPSPASYLSIHQEYVHAKKALAAARKTETHMPVFYTDLGIELLNDTIPAPAKREFVSKIIGAIHEQQWPETIRLLESFYNADGSLKAAADVLCMHPNTLQYHLIRIKELTGHDPRSYKDAALFLEVIAFYRESNTFVSENKINQ